MDEDKEILMRLYEQIDTVSANARRSAIERFGEPNAENASDFQLFVADALAAHLKTIVTEERQRRLREEQEKRRAAAPPVPNVMHNGRLTILSNPGIDASLAAYHNAQSRQDQDWKKGKIVPTYEYLKEHSRVHVELRPRGKKPLDDDMLTTEELLATQALLTGERQVPRITSLAGDALLALIAQALKTSPDEHGRYWITAQQILDYRGLEKNTRPDPSGGRRTAGHHAEALAAIVNSVHQLDNTWLRMDAQVFAEGESRGRTRRKQYVRHSRLIVLHDTIMQEELLLDQPDVAARTQVIGWRYSIGSWAEAFLSPPNRYTAELIQQCLKYDPYHDLWETRLSKYFTMAVRKEASHRATFGRQIVQIFNELSLPVDHDHPVVARQSFEKAMDRLVKDSVIASWRYKDGEPHLKRYGWLADWMNLSIKVTASSDARQQYRQIAEKSETRRARAEALKTASQRNRKKPRNG